MSLLGHKFIVRNLNKVIKIFYECHYSAAALEGLRGGLSNQSLFCRTSGERESAPAMNCRLDTIRLYNMYMLPFRGMKGSVEYSHFLNEYIDDLVV